MSSDSLENLANIISKSKNKKLREYFNIHLQEYKQLLNNYVFILTILDNLGFNSTVESKFDKEFIVGESNG